MSARTAKGWRWAKSTMKVLGIVIAGWIFASYRTNSPTKLMLGLTVLLVFAALVLGIAFALGWAVGGETPSRRSTVIAPHSANNMPAVDQVPPSHDRPDRTPDPIARGSSAAASIGYALLGLAGLLLPLGLFIGGVAASSYSLWGLLPMIAGGAGLVWMLIATRK